MTDFDHLLALADAGLCSGAREPTSLRIHLDLFQRRSEFIGVQWLFGANDQAARGMQDRARSFGWSGAEESARPGAASTTRKGVQQSTRARYTLQILGRGKAHLHDPLGQASLPAEGGRMRCSRARTQEPLILRITFSQPLTPFLTRASPNALWPEPILAVKRQGSFAAGHATGHDLASILRATGRVLLKKSKHPPLPLHCLSSVDSSWSPHSPAPFFPQPQPFR